MKLHQFLHFNKECPVCGNKLTLYMQVSGGSLWRAIEIKSGEYKFTQYAAKKTTYNHHDFMTLYDLDGSISTRFNSSVLGADSKAWQLFFFVICNNEAVEDLPFDINIEMYAACYYRSSVWFEFKKHPNDKKKWQLEESDSTDIINREEIFVFRKIKSDGVEKVYLLTLDSEDKKTKLYHYLTSPEERNLENFNPKTFEREDLPLLNVRPNFDLDKRDKLLSRFDTWIILS